MAGYGYRPPFVWYVPKPINEIDRIFDAFEILKSQFNGKNWSTSQHTFSKELEDNGIKGGSGGEMASRNWFTTFMYFGLAYEGKDRLVHITDLGNSVNNSNRKEVVINQLMRLQYPNPYQSKYVKEVYLFPYRVILKLLLELPDMKITAEELALFVIGLKRCSNSDIPLIAKTIAAYRGSTPPKKNQIRNSILGTYVSSVKKQFKERKKATSNVTTGKVWTIIYDYARRHFLTLEYTELCRYYRHKNYLEIPSNKVLSVRRLLSGNSLLKPSSFKDKEEWYYNYGSTSKSRPVILKVLSRKRYKQNKMLAEAEIMKRKHGKIDIKRLSEVYSTPAEEVLKQLEDHGYSESVEKEIGQYKVIIKIAVMGKKKGYSIHAGEIEQGSNRKLRELSTPMNTNNFGIPKSVFDELRLVDLVWLQKDRIICAFEVESGEIDREINKFRDIIVTTSLNIRFFIIVPDKNQRRALKRLNSEANKREGITNKIIILTYSNFRRNLNRI